MKRTVLTVLALCAVFAPAALAQSIPQQLQQLKAEVASLKAQLAAVQANNALKLGPFVQVNPNTGPSIIFHGANVQIVSGSGATDDNISHGGKLTGLGNLIIGYNEPSDFLLLPGGRAGSHNLVMGRYNFYLSYGGFVTGETNAVGQESSVITGQANFATAAFSSVLGGSDNNTELTHTILPEPPFP